MVKKKPTKKPANGKSNSAVRRVAPVAPAITATVAPSFRNIKYEMEVEVKEFRDRLVAKYSNFHGHDLRKDVAWLMEQMGIGITSDIERVKREARQKLIAENQAKEAADAAAAQK